MTGKIVRIRDYERKAREPDAVPRGPADTAVIVVLPLIRIERYDCGSFDHVVVLPPANIWP